jgi:hypothetical protein
VPHTVKKLFVYNYHIDIRGAAELAGETGWIQAEANAPASDHADTRFVDSKLLSEVLGQLVECLSIISESEWLTREDVLYRQIVQRSSTQPSTEVVGRWIGQYGCSSSPRIT